MANSRASVAKRPKGVDLETQRAALSSKRLELLAFYEHDIRAGKESHDESSDDFADRANNSYNRELMFSLSDVERETLIRVEEALSRIDEGAYGQCNHCGSQIGEPRLEAVPWARHCIDCQELEEQGLLYS